MEQTWPPPTLWNSSIRVQRPSSYLSALFKGQVHVYLDMIEAPDLENPIRGSHIRITPYHISPGIEVWRNSTGHIVNVTGMLIPALQWLAEVLDFTYEFNQDGVLPIFIENRGPTQPGLVNYLLTDQADLLIGAIVTSAARNKLMDFPNPIFEDQLVLLIPKPILETRYNFLNAIVQPFQLDIWIYLAISICVGIATLYTLGRIRSRLMHNNLNQLQNNTFDDERSRFEKSIIFVCGLILMQGSASSGAIGRNTNLAVRFFTGAWCLACFVLITAYSSVLISFLTTLGDYKTLVNSVNDLPKKPNIRVTVSKDLFADVLFQNTANEPDAGILYFLGQELKRHPELRFPTSQQCLDQVRRGSSVYIFTNKFLRAAIGNDWKNSGRCDFTLAKEKFLMVLVSGFFMQKNGMYREYFSREIMRMQGAGLFEFWLKQYSDDPTYCLTKIQRQMKEKSGKRRLTLNNLSGAFLVLVIGYVLSIIAFIVELYTARRQRRIKSKKSESLGKSGASDTLNVIKLVGTIGAETAEISPANTTTVIPSQQLTIDINNPVVNKNTTQLDIIIPSDEQLENNDNSLEIVDLENN